MDVIARRADVRQANRSIARQAHESEFVEPVPFICECGDTTCTGFARLAVDAFDVVASQPEWHLLGDRHGYRAAVVDAGGVVVELPALPHIVQ